MFAKARNSTVQSFAFFFYLRHTVVILCKVKKIQFFTVFNIPLFHAYNSRSGDFRMNRQLMGTNCSTLHIRVG